MRYLAFGDSNTHGTVPDPLGLSRARYDAATRWPTMAAKTHSVEIIEEGLPGRTTRYPDPVMGAHMDGRAGLQMALASHAPLDGIILMLGTNDLKARFGASPEAITAGMSALTDLIAAAGKAGIMADPRVLIVAPVPVDLVGPRQAEWRGAAEKSRALSALYADLAADCGVGFLDAANLAHVAPEEGIHWTPEAHLAFAAGLAPHLVQ